MRAERSLIICILLAGLVLLGIGSTLPAAASPGFVPDAQLTPFFTATPNAAGEILYVVQSGDSLSRIAAVSGGTVQEIAAMNGIEVNAVLSIGTTLLIGRATPVTPTFDPSQPEPTLEPSPTPTPNFGTADICILLYLDVNGNAQHEELEPPLADGQVSVAHVSGELAGEFTTTTSTELLDFTDTPVGSCLTELENGDYNVSVAVPENHNPTTAMNLPIRLNPGDTKYVQFGAQEGSTTGEVDDGGPGRSMVLGLLGGVMLLGAAGLAFIAIRMGGSRR